MADEKLTDQGVLSEAPATGDLFHVVDVSDTTDDAAGTSKKIISKNLLSGLVAQDNYDIVLFVQIFS